MSPERVSIRAVQLSKWYGKVTALQEVSFHLEAGIWGLLGPNGSGKTTLLRLAAGELRPSLGEMRVGQQAPFANPAALGRIGFCPEADALYDELTAVEFVQSLAELSGFSRPEARERARGALARFGLEDAMNRRLGGFSRGMRQRAKLAQAVVHDPDILLLDEPLTGTDPASRQVILAQLRERAAHGTLVLFSTHVLHEVEALTEHVLLIARGQVVAQGHVHEIRSLLEEHPHNVRVACDRPRELASSMLSVDSVVGITFPEPNVVMLATQDPDRTYPAIVEAAVSLGLEVASITSPDATLEALFRYLVERKATRTLTAARPPSEGSA